ncbi:non-ribosomal peptide synthetase [Pedobacter steynii]|uniref:Carrier domain-containing protein n=1 Tax=Pedobacter steynii TaxID=430522 RepID=A0A1D7QNE2_9SPHI|nr:non-ribosomal peptide synthetase [Pedobacter steynii]AOM80163.1 hypothetical protein BFS30_25180 [Pedobacter steynii]
MAGKTNLNFETIHFNKNVAARSHWNKKVPVLRHTAYFRPQHRLSHLLMNHGKYTMVIPEAIQLRLNEVANSAAAKHVVLTAALSILVQKYYSLNEAVIFTPLYRQTDEGKVIPVLLTRNDQENFNAFVNRVHQELTADFRYGHYFLNSISSSADVLPLFGQMTGLIVEGLQAAQAFDEYENALIFTYGEAGTLRIEMIAGSYHEPHFKAIAGYFVLLLEKLLNHAQIPVGLIEILEESDRQHLLYEFNKSEGLTLSSGYVPDLFSKQVRLNGSGCAVEAEGLSMTYLELDELSNQVAHYLTTEKGIQPGHLVGVLLGREYCLLPVILGVLKSGAAFIPIDIHAPAERVVGMLTDAHAQLLIMRDDFGLTLPSELQVSDLNKDWEAITSSASEASGYVVKEDSLAYVIYTSGSTGQPKGVMISHRALADYVKWADAVYVNGATSVFPLYSSIGFDLTITSIFVPLISGNTIRLYDHEESALLINHVLLDHKATVLKLTPSHLKIIRANFTAESLSESRIRTLIVGGEELESGLTAEIHELFGGRVNIFNEYGPTEATVGCMLYQYDPADGYLSVPIGSPADHMQIYTLDEHLQPVPFGAPGEIYISGSALSEGYLNNALLTAEKFIPNPFVKGSRMYKTGDLAIRVEGNKLIYKGRIDQQVQLRGFRIELEEICYALQLFAGIKEVHVSLLEVGEDQYLVAYYVADERIDERTLRSHIAELLPDYMHPSYYVKLHSFPLTSNGKLDVKLLPKPVVELEADHIAPMGAIEEQLAEIWSSVLGVDKALIGRNRSFFELGGHSIKSMYLINRINECFSIQLSMPEVFNHYTIELQSKLIDHADQVVEELIPEIEEEVYYNASAAQQRMYFQQSLNPLFTGFNICRAFYVPNEFNVEQIQHYFNQLIQRHESLRTSFLLVEGEVKQVINPPVAAVVQVLKNDSGAPLSDVLESFVRPFDLQKESLLNIGLLKDSNGKNLLIVDVHHIVADGISLNILVNDLHKIARGIVLPELKLQYRHFTSWIESRTKIRESQKLYWTKKLSGQLPRLSLPAISEQEFLDDYSAEVLRSEIDGEWYEKVKVKMMESQTTAFMFLLTSFFSLLYKVSGQTDMIVGSDATGRISSQLDHMVGTFVNILPMRIHLNPEHNIDQLLAEVRTIVLEGQEHQEFQFDQMIDLVEDSNQLSGNSIVEVHFSIAEVFSNDHDLKALSFESVEVERKLSSQYKFKVEVVDTGDRIIIAFIYNDKVYDQDTVSLLMDYYIHILKSVLLHPLQTIKDLDLESNS